MYVQKKNQINIDFKINPLSNIIEKYVIGKLNKKPPESYDKINPDELNFIYNQIMDSFDKSHTKNFSIQIILSIRANMMREHMIITHRKIISKEKLIISDYNSGTDLKELVIKYDGSPLNLLRIIFQYKYHKKLNKIIKNKQILSSHDKTQLDWAISHDAYALINQDEILTKSNEFEDKIAYLLDRLNIRYKTQSELASEQIAKSNIATNTPDFLILDELYINEIKINWIDAKNFYGSKSKFMIKKIKSQTSKYINSWGSGSIIFNLGFNSDLKIESILMIDYISFAKYKFIE
jgi:hypothetical protein